MKLYIDGLFYKASGIGRYYESIVKELARKEIMIITCVPQKYKDYFECDFLNLPSIKPIFVDYEKFSLKGIVKQSFILKKIAKEVDLLFFPHINFPFFVPKKSIVTIHDLIPFTKYWDRNMLKKYIYTYFLKRSIKYSEKIICISKTVGSELIHVFSNVKEKITVIYEFIDDKFVLSEKFKNPIIKKPYILFVGNRKKHKNLATLIKAFAKLKDKIPHSLVIAGSRDKNNDEIDKIKNHFSIENKIIEITPDDETLKNIYHYADLFVFPSLFEGFGLPPLESVALGTPVILSDIPILKEIFEDAGVYFNPLDENDIAEKIVFVLNDKKIQNSLKEKQKERLKTFNKETIIKQYIDLFCCVSNQKH